MVCVAAPAGNQHVSDSLDSLMETIRRKLDSLSFDVGLNVRQLGISTLGEQRSISGWLKRLKLSR